MAKDIGTIDGVMNLAEAMGRLGGDAAALQKMVTTFMQTGREQLATLQVRIAEGDVKGVASRVHGLRDSASSFCARRFVASAVQLERLARSGNLAGADALLAAMLASFAELDELVQLINWDEVAHNWMR